MKTRDLDIICLALELGGMSLPRHTLSTIWASGGESADWKTDRELTVTIDSRFKRVMVLLLRCVMNEIEVPLYFGDCSRPWLYLAGSIEMGAAKDWQEETVAALRDCQGTILNPRRDHWDPSCAVYP